MFVMLELHFRIKIPCNKFPPIVARSYIHSISCISAIDHYFN